MNHSVQREQKNILTNHWISNHSFMIILWHETLIKLDFNWNLCPTGEMTVSLLFTHYYHIASLWFNCSENVFFFVCPRTVMCKILNVSYCEITPITEHNVIVSWQSPGKYQWYLNVTLRRGRKLHGINHGSTNSAVWMEFLLQTNCRRPTVRYFW